MVTNFSKNIYVQHQNNQPHRKNIVSNKNLGKLFTKFPKQPVTKAHKQHHVREEKKQTFYKKTIRSYAINLEHFNRGKGLTVPFWKPRGINLRAFQVCLVAGARREIS